MAYPTRFTVRGLSDGKCWARPCMWPGEDKGTFIQGQGYTSYRGRPEPVCIHNHLHGCPHPCPEPDPESARCCFRPDYKRRGAAPVGCRECSTCKNRVPVKFTKSLDKLPTLPGVPCEHLGESEPTMIGWFQCKVCRGFWKRRPQAFEISKHTLKEYLAELKARLSRVSP